MLPPSRIKCSPSATHNPVTVDVGGEKKKKMWQSRADFTPKMPEAWRSKAERIITALGKLPGCQCSPK